MVTGWHGVKGEGEGSIILRIVPVFLTSFKWRLWLL